MSLIYHIGHSKRKDFVLPLKLARCSLKTLRPLQSTEEDKAALVLPASGQQGPSQQFPVH
jgi:hypothetical protein